MKEGNESTMTLLFSLNKLWSVNDGSFGNNFSSQIRSMFLVYWLIENV